MNSLETMGLISEFTCDLWNVRMPPIPSYVDKCGGWKQSSFEYHAPKNTPI